jgi:hypothetical protein
VTAFQRSFVNIVCLVLLSSIVAVAVYVYSPIDSRDLYSLCSVAITFVLFPIFDHTVKLAGASRSTVKDWIKSVVIGASIIGAMLVIDIILGVASHPEWPVIKSTMSNLGFVVTLFVSPVLLAAIFGLLRAVLVRLLFTHRTEQ